MLHTTFPSFFLSQVFLIMIPSHRSNCLPGAAWVHWTCRMYSCYLWLVAKTRTGASLLNSVCLRHNVDFFWCCCVSLRLLILWQTVRNIQVNAQKQHLSTEARTQKLSHIAFHPDDQEKQFMHRMLWAQWLHYSVFQFIAQAWCVMFQRF